jgi:hypothetical protein
VGTFRAVLREMTREQAPLLWALTQAGLGLALVTLGARENGTARLEDAVTANRAALQELTRERSAPDWASAQTNLGRALAALGTREGGTAPGRSGCGLPGSHAENDARTGTVRMGKDPELPGRRS